MALDPSHDEELLPSRQDWRARVVDHSLGEATGRALEDGRALISAASRLIMRSGGAEFSMHNVAAEAGVSRRVLYRLFEGRDDLLAALLEESHVVFARLIGEHADRFTDPVDRIGAALYFASDPRQLTDPSYNAALARFGMAAALRAPAVLGRTRRPVVVVFTGLVADALEAGRTRRGSPRVLGRILALSLGAYQQDVFVRTHGEVASATQDEFLRYCIGGLGADVPAGWTDRFHLSDDEAAVSRARTYELSGAIRRAPVVERESPLTRM